MTARSEAAQARQKAQPMSASSSAQGLGARADMEATKENVVVPAEVPSEQVLQRGNHKTTPSRKRKQSADLAEEKTATPVVSTKNRLSFANESDVHVDTPTSRKRPRDALSPNTTNNRPKRAKASSGTTSPSVTRSKKRSTRAALSPRPPTPPSNAKGSASSKKRKRASEPSTTQSKRAKPTAKGKRKAKPGMYLKIDMSVTRSSRARPPTPPRTSPPIKSFLRSPPSSQSQSQSQPQSLARKTPQSSASSSVSPSVDPSTPTVEAAPASVAEESAEASTPVGPSIDLVLSRMSGRSSISSGRSSVGSDGTDYVGERDEMVTPDQPIRQLSIPPPPRPRSRPEGILRRNTRGNGEVSIVATDPEYICTRVLQAEMEHVEGKSDTEDVEDEQHQFAPRPQRIMRLRARREEGGRSDAQEQQQQQEVQDMGSQDTDAPPPWHRGTPEEVDTQI